MSNTAALINAIVAVLWVGLAFIAVLILRNVLQARTGSLTKFGVGPSGVTMEFAEAKLDEAVSKSNSQGQQVVGQAAKRSVLDRLQRNSELLSRARILWADDHPEYNTAIVQLLRKFGATVETPKSNADGLELMRASRYDVVISDVARDNEGPGSNLKGLEFAEHVFNSWGIRVLLFTARFDPTTVPGKTDQERLALVRLVERCVFGITNRTDEALHLILDVLER
jgi:CheY-like chemotaxis protein